MKIDIIGSVASGKTTLAKRISLEYDIPFYEKDNIVWLRTENGDVRRTTEERDTLFQSIINTDNWIVEGSPRDCLNESFSVCDIIIVLNIPLHTRLKRVFSRWLRQRRGIEKYNSKPTLKFLFYNIKWVIEFNKKYILNGLTQCSKKIILAKSNKDAIDYIHRRLKNENTNI